MADPPIDARTHSAIPKSKDKHKGSKAVPQKRITGWRLWLFRIIAVTVIPALLFLLVELSLRIAGYGYPAAAIIKHEANGNVSYCDNVKFGWRFFPRNIAREFEPFIFPADKPHNTCRIFILGASAAMGTPDPAFCFGRLLRTMLRQEYPGADFEVVTPAMAAINSHVVLQIAKDCARHQPDLFVVYLGNNEVTGPYGAGTVFTPLSGSLSLIRTGIALKATKLGQLLTSLFESVGGERDELAVWRGMQMFLEKQIRADDPRLETVYQHFQQNLKDIKRVALKSGAKIIFCTVGSNLRDCPPFASLHRPDLAETENKKWDDIYKRAVELETAGDYAEAVEYYVAAAETDDSYADLQFRLGRCYWAMGEYDKARDRYIKARELDTLRFRADNRINQIIRNVAAAKAVSSVYVLDAATALESDSPHRTTGEELFHEHVHLNFKGNYLLAKTILEQMRQILPDQIKSQRATNRPLLTEAECAERLAYTDWDRYRIADQVLNDFIKKPPFTNQLYHDEEVSLMGQELRDLKVYLRPEALEKSAAQYRRAIENDSGDWRLHYKYGRLLAEDLKDYQAAAKEYRLVQHLLPHCHLGYDALGSVLRGLGDLDAAIAQYLKAIQIRPTSADPHYYVGWVYQKQGNTDKAVEYYSKTVQLQPNYVPAYNNLAEILNRRGKVDEAVKICRRGLHFAPNNAILHGNLGMLLNKQGHRNESLKELNIALELDPNSTNVRKVLRAILRNRTD